VVFRNVEPMCRKEESDLEPDDYYDAYDDNEVRTRRFKDGTSTVFWGGPCSPVNYDEYGEEC
jgi:hypothetical protein